MPPVKLIEITYIYLKQGKWKSKVVNVNEEDVPKFDNNNDIRILSKKEIYG